jgi:raffinose/stachyose/melibiose transport system substrate-binding protein
MKKQKWLAALLVLVMVISLLAACGSSDTESSTASSSTESSKTEESKTEESTASEEEDYKVFDKTVNLSILFSANSAHTGMDAVFAEAEERFNIHVDMETRVGGDEGETLVRTRLASGDMADICWFNSGALFFTLDPAKNFIPLTDEEYMGKVMDIFKKTVTVDDDVYGIPVASSQGAVFLYNRPIFEDNGYEIPEDWESLMALCEQMQADGVTPFGGTFADSWTAQLMLLGGYYELEQQVPDFAEGFTNHTITFAGTPEAVRIFEKSNEMLKYTADDYLAAKYTDGQLGIAEGQYAMWPMLTQAIPKIQEVLPDKVNDVGAFAFPADDKANTGVTLWMPDELALNANLEGEKLEAAKQLLRFYISEEGLALHGANELPKGTYVIEGSKLPDDAPQAIKDMQKYVEAGQYGLALEFQTSVKGPNSPQICTEAYSGTMTPEAAAQAYDEDCEKQAKQLGIAGW